MQAITLGNSGGESCHYDTQGGEENKPQGGYVVQEDALKHRALYVMVSQYPEGAWEVKTNHLKYFFSHLE